MRKSKLSVFLPIVVLASSLALPGCRSHQIDSTIDNRTGAAIHQVEVDYPSASFGIDTLAPGQIYLYRFQVRGDGPMKVQYTDATGKQIQRQGPPVAEGDRGQYLIILLPHGDVQWEPSLTK
jgi:hypothetical protein